MPSTDLLGQGDRVLTLEVGEAWAHRCHADAFVSEDVVRDGEDKRAVDAAGITHEHRAHLAEDLGEVIELRIMRQRREVHLFSLVHLAQQCDLGMAKNQVVSHLDTGYLFSMQAIAKRNPLELLASEELARLAHLGVAQGTNGLVPANESRILSLDWPELERVLPDRGFPRGVVEIASSMTKEGVMRGGATTLSLEAVRAVQAADSHAWCAWVTETTAPSLYAPAVAEAGISLERLLVVRPEPSDLARTVVKIASSGACDLVVVDVPFGLDGRLTIPVSSKAPRGASGSRAKTRGRVDGSVVVRKLALASEEKGTTFLLLTNVYAPRSAPWPVALRLEVERRPEAISIRVTKDRRGRSSSQHVVRLAC